MSLLQLQKPWGQKKPPYGSAINHAHPLAKGLVGAWMFNESAGNAIYDISGNSNNSINFLGTGSTRPSWSNGKFGSAIYLDGTSTIQVPNSSSLTYTTTTPITVSAWIKVDSLISGFQEIIRKGDGGDSWFLLINTSNFLNFSPSGNEYVSGTPFPNDGLWHHCVGTFDGNPSGTVSLYIDGVFKTSYTGNYTSSNTDDLYIGSLLDTTQFYAGAVDNLLIYKKCLSATEVQKLYTQPFCFIQPPRVRLYTPPATPPGNGFSLPVSLPWGNKKPAYGTRIDPEHPLSQGMVLGFLMNEMAGRALYDITGQQKPAAFNGGVTWVNGPFGPCLSFDGVSGSGVGFSAPTLGSFSWVSWINPATVGGSYKNLFTQGSSRGMWLNGAKIDFYEPGDRFANTSLSANTLYQVGVTYDAVTGAGKFILNGAPDGTSVNSIGNSYTFDGMGADGGSGGETYTGLKMYDLLYNRVLSNAEFAELYAQPFCFMRQRKARFFSSPGVAPSSQIKTIDGLAIASVKLIDGLANASMKTFNGVANS